ncbi:HutD family protein [Hydrocarboniphaga effusa]|jgi:environmental stress-induced protein Ves|uniref:HutD/Ves family protein n=1 Tax=Hydrocarboniphaga effusa TaxID=243629 RepID=UPI0035AE93B3
MHASPDRFKVLRAKSYARMPWKNGGGETREIAIFPSAASLDTLEWRVSMAVVAQNGPFSSFPGIDRTLCVLEGAGMELDFGSGGGIRTVTPTSAPFEFAADRPLQARLLDGAITDLNVMSRRERYRHSVRRLPLEPRPISVGSMASWTLLFCEQGNVRCRLANDPEIALDTWDCLLLSQTTALFELRSDARATAAASVCLIELYRIKP